MARRADTWQELWNDGAKWLDRYEARIAAELEELRHHAPGVPPNSLRVDLERGASPLAVARYYAAQQKH